MPSLARARGPGLPWVILAGVASAALFYFGTGLQPIWWMVWLAPVPVLAIAPRLGRRAAFLLAAGAWFAGEFNMWSYFTRVVQVPLPITLVLFVVPALVFALGVLLVPQLSPAWRAAKGGARFSRLLGLLPISLRGGLAAQHLWQSRLSRR